MTSRVDREVKPGQRGNDSGVEKTTGNKLMVVSPKPTTKALVVRGPVDELTQRLQAIQETLVLEPRALARALQQQILGNRLPAGPQADQDGSGGQSCSSGEAGPGRLSTKGPIRPLGEVQVGEGKPEKR